MSSVPPLPALPRLPPALPRSGLSADARRALRQVLGDADRALAQAFSGGADARVLVARRGQAVDSVVLHAWQACLGDGGGCALFAVGGYGRGGLFPHSDVDLLVLGKWGALGRQSRALEAFFAALWDAGLAPGHAIRTPAECRGLATQDVAVFTSLLDARRLAGEAAMEQALAGAMAGLWPPPAFLAAKRAEQAARHARFDDTAYNLEPNLKEGPGGLRTLDLMRWLGARVAGARDFAAMVEAGLLDPDGCAALHEAEAVLLRYRFALHLAAGRAEERLLFDHQRRLAAELGYTDEHERNLAVEQFMQAYYRAATVVERLGVQLVERCTELLESPASAPEPLDRDFAAVGERIEPLHDDLFLRRPRAIIDLFALQLDHPRLQGLSARTMRLLQEALGSHRDEFAGDAHVLGAFLALLRRGAPAVEALARMNRHGVLAAVLPPFRQVVGRMQYDLFHVYTVDEHTLRVLRHLARFAGADAREGFPHARETWAGLERPELLLLAALFHDIAKGRGGDHSVLGEEEARAFCTRLALPPGDAGLVAWLVRWHLLMSVTAQRQDITDPDVVHRFAVQVGDRERLDHLYLLTMADIAGTNPRLWNDWKARLLADLFTAARFALRAGLSRPPHAGERAEACRREAQALLEQQGNGDAAAVDALLSTFPPASFLRQRPAQIAWQAQAIAQAGGGMAVAVRARSNASSELFVHAPDRDGLFAAIAAALDRLGLAVVGARLFAAPAGVFDTFELLEGRTAAALEPARAAELRAVLLRVLAAAELSPRLARRHLPRRLRHFQRAPQVGFSAAGDATQLALVCSDRPGVLARAALALREARVRVHDARIATFGDRVEDFFVLTGEDNQALDEAAQERVRTLLLRHLGGAGATGVADGVA